MPLVLVVDDEHRVCETLADLFEAEGFVPVCVRSDRQAFEALRRHPRFSCLVVDVNLGPGTTGFDVARFARQLDPALAVIYISGDAREASFRAHGVPASTFLEKPFTPSELLDRVRALVGDNDD
jgi:DNA-binding response OmpR family regulator